MHAKAGESRTAEDSQLPEQLVGGPRLGAKIEAAAEAADIGRSSGLRTRSGFTAIEGRWWHPKVA